MLEPKSRDRRAERCEATRGEILEAAWSLAREHGLAGLTLRDVARRIGMQPPSLYWYFHSKNAIYDAMFAEGNRLLLERLASVEWPTEPRALLLQSARMFVEFSAEDIERYQLLFQRTIPDFEPSAQSYALAVEVVDRMRHRFAVAGLGDATYFDIWTALVAGLASQQTANEPGGDRWLRLIDEVADMFADHVMRKRTSRSARQ